MRELQIDAWEAHKRGAWVCVLTNGIVNRRGEAVMGRGIALEAKTRFPELPRKLGIVINAYGNKVFQFTQHFLFTFPTKHHYREVSSPELIQRSAVQLRELVMGLPPDTPVVLPRPGCGYGGLDYETEVKPILEEVDLPDNIVIIHP